MDIPFHMTRADIPAIARETGEGMETCARRLRYQFLRDVKARIGADYIALAHHMDDQTETVLMHLFRGTGPEGVTGMKALSGDLFRPLLSIRKEKLVEYVRSHGIKWREDSTNLEADTPRNALRLNAIPEIEKSYPQAVSAVARFARSAAVENEFMARLSEEFSRKNLVEGPFGKLLKLPEGSEAAIVRRVIRRICGPELDFEKLSELAALCEKNSGKTDVFAGMFAERGRMGLYFLPKTPVQIPEKKLCLNGITEIDGFCQIEAKSVPPVPVKDNPLRQVLRKNALEGAVVRTRRNGDRIRPLGSGEKLLSDYFTDRKIDRPLRDFVPLIAKDNNILWAAGIGISEDACIQSSMDACISLTIEHKFSL
ncbi:MAG: tRNA lysidine(34) synthetase TilS, partial [Clostridia bacterium]|nr:tRNA lysidine(34) synthetase TilS [Clostridia bacterium]